MPAQASAQPPRLQLRSGPSRAVVGWLFPLLLARDPTFSLHRLLTPDFAPSHFTLLNQQRTFCWGSTRAESWTWQGAGMGSPSEEGTLAAAQPTASLSSKRLELISNLLK